MKITIKGAYGETNFGDDLLMIIFEKYFLSEFPNVILNFCGEKELYPSKLLEKASYNKKGFQEDLLVYGGGTQFFSFGDGNVSLLQKIRAVINNPKLLYNKFFANVQNSKIAFLGIGLGPFENERGIGYTQNLLNAAYFVGVRDLVSQDYCDKWGIKSVLGADMVFSSYFKYQLSAKICKGKSIKRIGVIVRDWRWETTGRQYYDSLYDLTVSDNIEYQFIVFAPKKDKEWIEKLKDKDVLVWEPEKYTVQEFLNIINNFDAIISARYHGAIIAALLGKPVICVEIESKLKILKQQVPQLYLWEKPFHKKQLTDLVQKLDIGVDYSESMSSLRDQADYMLSQYKKCKNAES